MPQPRPQLTPRGGQLPADVQGGFGFLVADAGIVGEKPEQVTAAEPALTWWLGAWDNTTAIVLSSGGGPKSASSSWPL
ncbi:MAG: hypothetical protein SYR96_04900 [Actinomycetota bacterium]|nr:hypothetical protein [Actinomycetota bacterium]